MMLSEELKGEKVMPADHPNQREEYLTDALDLLNEATHLLYDLSQKKLEGRDQELHIPLVSCCNTAVGIHKLLYRDVHTEHEAYMLMRALMERIVNFHYLRVTDKDEVERYFMHAWYRMYHMTNRQEVGQKGNVVLKLNSDAREQLKADPTIQKALRLFSETKPGMDWTKKTFTQRIRFIGDKGAIKEEILLLASMITYADASEILHGTFYGEVFLTGAFTPGAYAGETHPSPAKVNKHISSMLRLPVVVLAGLMIATVQAIARDHGFTEFLERASILEAGTIPILKDTGVVSS